VPQIKLALVAGGLQMFGVREKCGLVAGQDLSHEAALSADDDEMSDNEEESTYDSAALHERNCLNGVGL